MGKWAGGNGCVKRETADVKPERGGGKWCMVNVEETWMLYGRCKRRWQKPGVYSATYDYCT